MGSELLKYPVFAESVKAAESYLRALGCRWSVTEELLRHEEASQLNFAEYSLPISIVMQVALVDLLTSWKVLPQAVVGHSSGEIAAAYCVGAICRQSAWLIAYYRGVVSSMLQRDSNVPQAMLVTGLSEDRSKSFLNASTHISGCLSVACFNSHTNTTISGSAPRVDAVCSKLHKEGVFARKLNVDMAYHSPYMEAGASWYMDHLQTIQKGISPPHPITMFSTVSGQAIHPDHLCRPQYWADNMVLPVKFFQAVQSLKMTASVDTYEQMIEIGPHNTLMGPPLDTAQSYSTKESVDYRSILVRNRSSLQTALELAGHLFVKVMLSL